MHRVLILAASLPVIYGSFSPDAFDFLYDYEVECRYRSGATFGDVESARENHRVLDNFVMKAFSLCMLKKFNVMHQNNTVNTDVSTFDILTDAIDETVHKKCIEQAGNEPLAAAMKVMNCFLEHRELVMAPYPRKPIN